MEKVMRVYVIDKRLLIFRTSMISVYCLEYRVNITRVCQLGLEQMNSLSSNAFHIVSVSVVFEWKW